MVAAAGYMRHPMYGGLLMASLGLAAVSHDESRLLAAAVLWLVLEQKVCCELICVPCVR
jgi:protein-S-isoprenylcysteine O-methyltransferase Ste14